jgi:hypothetical protein
VSHSLVLDAGALIGIARQSPRLQELMRAARRRETTLVIPTVVVAQTVMAGGRQANLRRFLADSCLRFVVLDYHAALEAGALLGASGTADVVSAAVIACARAFDRCPVVTSDPEDLRKLDGRLPLIPV